MSRIVPFRALPTPRASSSAAPSSAIAGRTRLNNARPASVSVTERVVRVNTATPI